MADHAYYAQASEVVQKNTSGTQCFAINCNNYKNKDSTASGISFHRFPPKDKESDRNEVWARNCRRQKKPSPQSLLCSSHFEAHCFDRTGQTVRLKMGAIPTIFHLPGHLQTKNTPCRTTKRCLQDMEESDIPTCSGSIEPDPSDHLSNEDHTYCLGDTDCMRNKIKMMEERIVDLEKRTKRTAARERRSKARCKDLVETLKEQNLITSELEHRLASYKDIPVALFHKPKKEYSEEQKKFALTMHLYSPKGYEFLRKSLPLPSSRSLRKWMEKIDAEPGLNVSMLQALQKKREENSDEYTHCCLTIDAMHIRKQLIYDPHKRQTVGFVNIGIEEEQEEAKEALVFMVVGLKGHWKAPISYYLTTGLTAETQSRLVLQCLEKLAEIGLKTHCLTMDGHLSNIGMCSHFDASMDIAGDLKPYISLPGTYILLDPCHMLKLVRNTLESYSVIKSPKGDIMWNYIKDLDSLQHDLGLKLANKLSSQHINFYQSKMKVCIAAQTISNSVAKALLTLKELGVPKFAECEATVEFLETHLHYRLCSSH